jgi:transposase
MPRKRSDMRRVKEVLRLAHELGYSLRQIAESVRLGRTSVRDYLTRADAAGVRYEDVAGKGEAEIAALLFRRPEPAERRPQPDWAEVAAELAKPAVTLLLVWQEYRDRHPDGYSYSQFRRHYRSHQQLAPEPRMRRTLLPAQLCEVDYAGMTMPVITAHGERQAIIFVGTLPFSTLLYAEATWTQAADDWLASHARMFAAWGGSVPKLVPDNLKTGVTHASFYDPVLNPSYLALARHYGIGIVPARVRRPRDKPLVENGVQQVERWILAPLRNRQFFSLDELNAAIAEQLAMLNNRPLSADAAQTRACVFKEHEQPKLRALPREPFVVGRWQRFKLGSDYHIRIDGVAYSAPFGLIGKLVDVHYTASLVGIFHQGERVASHARSRPEPGVLRPAITLDEHRPPQHRAVARLSPEAVREAVAAIGGALTVLSDRIFLRADHPEQAARQVAGLIALGETHGADALQSAATAALSANVHSYAFVRAWLASGRTGLPCDAAASGAGLHENLRGPAYYH